MSKSAKKISRSISIHLKLEEYERIRSDFSKTTCRSLNEYMRKRLAGKPVTVFYRDQSFDEFIEEGIQLRKRLDGVLSENIVPEPERTALALEIMNIKELLSKIYDHVRKNKIH